MNRRRFEEMVDRALQGLPDWVKDRLDNLIVVVEDRPEGDDLLGVYEGVALPERSGDYWGALPDRIVIYRIPHLDLGLDDEALEAEVRKTVLHEIAHHIGIDDARLDELGWD